MNEHVELVKRWLDDPASVTQQELEKNARAAWAAARAAQAADTDARVAGAAVKAAQDADAMPIWAVFDVAYWMKRFEEINDE